MLPNVFIGLASCFREENYIDPTLASLRQGYDGPFTIFIDGERDTYICKDRAWWSGDIQIVTGFVTENYNLNVYSRGRMNMIRAAEHTPVGFDFLFLEDDLEFADNWYERLIEIVKECYWRFGDRFILSLWNEYGVIHAHEEIGIYHYEDFHGTCGVYFTNAVLYDLITLGKKEITLPADVLVKKLLSLNGQFSKKPIHLKQTNPNLIQHKGDLSTTGATRIMRSPSYRKEEQ